MALLLSVRERPRMDDEYRILFIYHEDDLQEFPLGGRTPYEEFLIRIRDRQRIIRGDLGC
jgi:hypothetical protein